MAKRLNASDADFRDRFAGLLTAKRELSHDVDAAVAGIIADVRQRGDAALVELTAKFDAHDRIAPTAAEIAEAAATCPDDVRAALELAAGRIADYHRRQLPGDERYRDDLGVELGHRWTPVDAVGVYVPGGSAAYPSSVLMNVIPARVAGVERIAMVVPTPGGDINPAVLAAAHIAGVDEIYTVGGAQAIAALAYGTASIAPVAKIVGPGNAYVAAAKRQVFGVVGIDMIAGPSEVLIIADSDNDPDWLAADLLAQAEHDPCAQSILICDDGDLADRVEEAVDRQLKTLPRADIAAASWRDFGAIIVVDDIAEAVALSDAVAPEHLEVTTADAEAIAARVRHAGALFIGHYSAEALGDYVAGPNHVLPTARSARFASGLGVLDFMKRTTLLKCPPEAFARIAPAAETLAASEGLDAHARSLARRRNRS